MIDQLVIGNKYSYDNFGASMKERKIHSPEKKIIKDTVPFSNQVHDFSAINGEVYWNERMLEYVFEILANSPEELEEKKQKFFNWIMNVVDEEIHDPYIKNYHFVGSYESSDPDDSEVEKSTIKVIFSAYPYKIANEAKKPSIVVESGAYETMNVLNNSSHRITPTITASSGLTLELDGETYELKDGAYMYDEIMLKPGMNELTVHNTSEDDHVFRITYIEEVL